MWTNEEQHTQGHRKAKDADKWEASYTRKRNSKVGRATILDVAASYTRKQNSKGKKQQS
jgi:hypothetical protein